MATNVEEIKSRLSITDIVGSYVKLEKAGINYKARCPFHNEKTPSFFVSPDRGSYYCFGCHAKGDIFSFVEAFEGLDFKGALKVLADKAGVKLEKFSGVKSDDTDRLYGALEEATLFFENILAESDEAKSYVTKRGIKDETVKNMRVGYVKDEWRSLRGHLLKKGYTDKEMQVCGLIKSSLKPDSEPYDVFRGRIMFPISDSSGRVVAFSGRILKDDPQAPKYLNSPETILYNKSKILYGLDKAKYTIRKCGYTILVEGQMDLVMSHQAGFSNSVATSGTAFSSSENSGGKEAGIALLKRLSKNIIIAFDSDKAGYEATLRVAREALLSGMEVKAVTIIGGKDPADIIRDNPKSFAGIIRDAKPIVPFILARIKSTETSEKKILQRVATEALPYVAYHESAIEKGRLVEYLSLETGMRSDALWADMIKLERKVGPVAVDQGEKITKSSRSEEILKKIFGMAFSKGNVKNSSNEFRDILKGDFAKRIGEDVFEKYEKLEVTDRNALIMEYETLYPKGMLPKEIEELVSNLEKERIKKDRDRVSVELKKAEVAKDKDKSNALLKEYGDLSKRLAM